MQGVFSGCFGLEWVTSSRTGRSRARTAAPSGQLRWVAEVERSEGPGRTGYTASVIAFDGRVVMTSKAPSEHAARVRAEITLREHGVDVPESYPAFVMRRRTELGMAHMELARLAGINATTVRDIEVHGTIPAEATREKIEKVIGPQDPSEEPGYLDDNAESRIVDLESVVRDLTKTVGLLKEQIALMREEAS